MAPIATLTVRISAQIAELQKSFNEGKKAAQDFQESFAGVATAASTVGTFLGNVFTKLASSIVSGIGSAIQSAVKYSTQFSNAFMGLSGVAEHFGVSVDAATAAAKQLSADGMLPLADSVTGLKNLLATGFGLADSVKLMNAFKDSAAFGRQSSYSFGDAVRSATEGVKNQQNALIDNAGVTKNVAQIMKEAGMTMADLADKTKGASARQALLSGILRETAAQAGDAAKASKTYQGAISAVDAAQKSLLATWGDAITRNESVQVALVAVSDALRGMNDASTDNKKAFYLVSDSVTFLIRTFANLLSAIDKIQYGFMKVDEVISGSIARLSKGISDLAMMLLKILALSTKIPGGAAIVGTVAENEIAGLSKIATTTYDTWKRMSDQLVITKKRSEETTATLQPFIAGLRELADKTEAARGKMIDLGEAPKKGKKSIEELLAAMAKGDKVVDTFRELASVVKTVGDNADFGRALAALNAQLPPLTKGLKDAEKNRDAAFGLDAVKKAYLMVEALGDITNISKLTEEQQKQLTDAVRSALDVFNRMGVAAPEALRKVDTVLLTNQRHFEMMRDAFADMGKRFTEFADFTKIESKVPQLDFGTMLGYGSASSKQDTKVFIDGITDAIKKMETSVRPVFKQLAIDIPRIMGEAFSRGDNMWAAAATAAADIFAKAFQERLARSKTPGGEPLTGGEKLMGLAGTGISGFMGGFSMGTQGGKMKGALGGAASGAMSGFMVGGPIGAAVGGIAGLVGGLFGGAKKAKQERAELEKNKAALLEQYGGMKNLQKLAQSLGVDIQKAFDAKKPAQFTAAVEELNKAIEEQKKRIEGLNNAVEGLNTRAGIFGQKFQKILDAKPPEGATKKQAQAFETDKAQSLAALAQSSGDEFDRLGLIARDTFAGLVKENGNAITAMQMMGPTFQTLTDGVDKFGLTASAVTQEMIDNFKLVNDEAFKPLFDTIAADGQVLRGLFDAKALSPEGFQAIAADIGASIQGIVDKGGDMSRTLALSQPVLQTLWEAQQQYGAVTDDTTASILKQAEEQGLVGEAMKGTNEKILDVLLAIGKVLGADIPSYFDALKQPAADAAASIEGSFANIDIPPLVVPYKFKQEGGGLPSGDSATTSGTLSVPALAGGGIVKHRTLALIGEAGPEAVVPLNGNALGVGPQNYETTIYLDGEQIARSSARRIPRIMRTMGVGH